MTSILFSIAVSVSLLMVFLMLMKNKIIKNYGFGLIYTVCIILAVRLIIPYSFQLPDINIASFRIPRFIIPIWAAGAAISLIYQLSGYFYFLKQLKRYSYPVLDEDINLIYKQTKNEMFIDKNIPVRFSSKADSPMLKGIVRPEIILTKHPYTPAEYSMIFRHELTHYKNRDNIKKLFFIIVSALQWFNPFMYMLSASLNESIECLCDEKVVRNKDSNFKRDYSLMILKTAKTNSIPLVSSLSAKEKMKMRLGNIFDNTKKKSSVLPAIAVTVSAVLLSSFFCSCTLDTPDDVKDEMNRIESGIENEQSAEVSDNSGFTLKSVSEVTANAKSEIEKISSVDGIFKFDDCNVMIPQVSEFPEYEIEFDAGLTPKTKYEQFKDMEKQFFGEGYFDDGELLIDPGTYMGDGYVSLDEFLKLDDPYGIIACFIENGGKIENQISVNWYRLPDYSAYYDFDDNIVKSYNCLDITDDELKEEWELKGGKMTTADIIKLADKTIEKISYSADENVNYKVSHIDIAKNSDNKHVVNIRMQIFYKEIPFTSINKNYDDTDEIKISGAVHDNAYMYMDKAGEIGEARAGGTNMALTPTGKKYTEIIPVEQVFALLKKKLSNSIVYDVKSVTLGFSADDGGTSSFLNSKTYPIYNIFLKTTQNELRISIDALTGDMNVCKKYH